MIISKHGTDIQNIDVYLVMCKKNNIFKNRFAVTLNLP